MNGFGYSRSSLCLADPEGVERLLGNPTRDFARYQLQPNSFTVILIEIVARPVDLDVGRTIHRQHGAFQRNVPPWP